MGKQSEIFKLTTDELIATNPHKKDGRLRTLRNDVECPFCGSDFTEPCWLARRNGDECQNYPSGFLKQWRNKNTNN